MAAVRDCGFELVDHPPHSDLALSIFCFRTWTKKTHLAGKQYRTNDKVKIYATEDLFEDQDESFYTTGIQAQQHRWKKTVDRREVYVEK